MIIYKKLKVPSFDLSWVSLLKNEILLIPGGGGSSKSGVKNCIQILKLEELNFSESFCFETDTALSSDLCCGVCCGMISNSPILCAMFDKHISIYKINDQNDISKLLTLVCTFDASILSLNCSIITQFGSILTAGDEKTIKLWDVLAIEGGNSWESKLKHEFTGHEAPITGLTCHPTKTIFASISRSGTTIVWDYAKNIILHKLIFGDPIKKYQTRGCSFICGGDGLLIVQNEIRGPSSLVEWDLKSFDVQVPKRTKTICNMPCTKLAINDTSEYIAIGSADGSVFVYSLKSLFLMFSKLIHDLPVTGLSFAPSKIAERNNCAVVLQSCSADYALATYKIEVYSLLRRIILLLCALLIITFGFFILKFLYLESFVTIKNEL